MPVATNCCTLLSGSDTVEGVTVIPVNADTANCPRFSATPLTVTTRLPLVAPVGTGTTISVPVQLDGVATAPLNVTEPVLPRFIPVITTVIPTAATVGENPEIDGLGKTVNCFPLLAIPDTVTTTLPVDAPVGTVTNNCFVVQLDMVAGVP